MILGHPIKCVRHYQTGFKKNARPTFQGQVWIVNECNAGGNRAAEKPCPGTCLIQVDRASGHRSSDGPVLCGGALQCEQPVARNSSGRGLHLADGRTFCWELHSLAKLSNRVANKIPRPIPSFSSVQRPAATTQFAHLLRFWRASVQTCAASPKGTQFLPVFSRSLRPSQPDMRHLTRLSR